MKFIANSTNLLKHISAIQSITQASSVISILENFLFILDRNSLSVVACDLESTALIRMSVESQDEGKICIPSKILIDSLRNISDQPLTFNIDEADKQTIEISSSTGKYKITGHHSEDFPKIPTPSESSKQINLDAELLSKGIQNTLVAVSQDDMKPEMNGVLFEMNPDYLRLVSTDSHRLVVYTIKDVKCPLEKKMIIPKKPLSLLKTSLANQSEPVSIQFSENHFFLKLPNFELACRLIDAKFPDYSVVIPESNPFQILVNRLEFQNSLNRVGVFSNKITHMVKLELKGQNLNLFAQDLDYAFEANENLQCDYQGEDIEIGFNSKFLVDLLQILSGDDIKVELSAPSKPSILTSPETLEGVDMLILLMPLMISKGPIVD